jgi:outer membrane protein assembly factor BamC
MDRVVVMVRTAVVLAAAAFLAGCSFSLNEGSKIDYKSAGKLPTLEVPPDLTQPGRDERYSVPDTVSHGSATYSAYRAERSGQQKTAADAGILAAPAGVRLERAGSQRWLVVSQNPDKLWPVVKQFWQELGFIINLELPDAGIMETDWAENRAKIPQDILRRTLGKLIDQAYSTAERDKFRTRLEGGKGEGTTEVYISHRGMYEVFASEGQDRTVWQPRPADPELEAEMLGRLMTRLGVEEGRARALVTAATSAERARLEKSADGSSVLQMAEPFDRAWRRVGLALDRVGFTVVDRDRSQGVYFVRYVDPEADNLTKKDEGILSKLAFWRSDPPKADSQAQYRILVSGQAEASKVSVLTREGGTDRSATAGKILALLHEQLK